MNKISLAKVGLLFTVLVLGMAGSPVQAKYIGGDYPKRCQCENCSPVQICSSGACMLCRTQGNLNEAYPVTDIGSASGALPGISLSYNSYNADGNRAQIDTGLGYGWTHSYNIFLLRQRGHIFRMDGDGMVTRFKRGRGGTFTPTTGYFENLEWDPKVRTDRYDDVYTIRQTDGTRYQFEYVPDTPFYVMGPVWRLTSITDRNDNVTTLTYTNGDLTAVTDTYGRTLTLGYDAHGLVSITDPQTPPRTTTLEYDDTGRKLTTITDPEGNTTTYRYNFLYQLTEKVDKDGRKTSFLYRDLMPVGAVDGDDVTMFDMTNPVNWATDPLALARTQLREYIPSTTTVTDGRGNPWQYEYDLHGYITQIIAPDGATTTFTYDPVTLMLASQTDANGNTTSYEYDAHGNLIKETDALGYMTTYEYADPASFDVPLFDRLEKITDPNGRETTYEYDTKGNRTKETDPLGNMRSWTYDSHGNVLTETDKNGNITEHTYDAFGSRTKTTDAKGQPEERTTTFDYDIVGNLLSRTDDNGHTTTFEYDDLDRLVKETDPAGNMTLTEYDGMGNRTRATDCNGNATLFEYDVRQRLIKTTDALGQMSTQTYDDNDNRTSATDKNGNTTTFEYDLQNRLIKMTDALGNMSTRTYDGVGNLLSETDANGHTTTHEYDALNRRIKTTDAVGCMTLFEYDGVGLTGCPECTGPTLGSSLVTKQIDGNGKVTYFKYDGLDRRIIEIRKEGDTADVIDPSDAVTTSAYDPNGNRLSVTEPNGNTTTFVYDGLNRVVQETNAAGDTTLTTYDGVDNVITVTAPNGNVTTNTYDVLDRVIQVNDSVGLVATFTYDCLGNRLTERDGNGNGTTNTYDAIYRLIKVTDALGEMTLFDYDPVGNLIKTTDREDNVTCHSYDALNRRIQTAQLIGGGANCALLDADDIWTRTEYDPVGNVIRLITAKGSSTPASCASGSPPADCEITTYAYDGVNRLVNETYPDGGMRTFTYDCVGNLLSRTDQKGQTTGYDYNDLYFLVQRDYPVSADDNFSYDLSGRMETAERDGWLVTFDYDGANRVIETTQDGQIVTYAYDIPGRTRTVTYPGGRVITEFMDPRDRLSRVDRGAGPIFPITPIALYGYDPGNRVQTRQYENGVVGAYLYNANNWITKLEHTVGATLIAGFGYDYDKEGNKRFEEKQHDTTNSEAYDYDDIYRLIDYKVGALVGSTVPVPSTQTAYDLDKLGNWDQFLVDADGAGPGVPVDYNNTPNRVNEYDEDGPDDGIPDDFKDDKATPGPDGENWVHDANGNRTEDGKRIYEYDEENRLIRVTRKSDGVVSGYQYDALGRRVVKTTDLFGTPTVVGYFYDDARAIEEQDEFGATVATYVYGNYIDEVLTMDRAVQVYYYHQKSLASVVAVSDKTAAVVERYGYDAYGCVTVTDGAGAPVPPNAWGTAHSAIGNPYLFTGRRLDEETGLYYYRARYYDCESGRFLQRDLLGYVDGMNLYEYAKDNPVIFGDPSGAAISLATVVFRVAGNFAISFLASVTADQLDKLFDNMGSNLTNNFSAKPQNEPGTGGSESKNPCPTGKGSHTFKSNVWTNRAGMVTSAEIDMNWEIMENGIWDFRTKWGTVNVGSGLGGILQNKIHGSVVEISKRNKVNDCFCRHFYPVIKMEVGTATFIDQPFPSGNIFESCSEDIEISGISTAASVIRPKKCQKF